MAEKGYALAAPQYWLKGWRSVLPLPPARKKDPPRGFTGYDGNDPSYADVQEWIEHGAFDREVGKYPGDGANLALRLPNTVVGIDVDAYEGKTGGATLAEAEKRWGELPPTYRTGSRKDELSGIRLYRVPAGVLLRTIIGFDLGDGQRCGDIEIVQHTHRYAVAWPSIHPDTGRMYRWQGPDGFWTADIPRPAELPELPATWLEGLRREVTAPTEHADVATVLARLPKGPMTMPVQQALERSLNDLKLSGSRHDNTNANVLRLFRLADDGHTGVEAALGLLGEGFVKAVSDRSDESAARLEFGRMVAGQRGHDLIASTPNAAKLIGLSPAEVAERFAELGHTNTPTPGQTAVSEAARPPSEAIPPDPVDALLFTPTEGSALDYATEDVASRTSWGAVDLSQALAGELCAEEPTECDRGDGACLFYAGRVNGLVGESESGKSWVAQHVCAEAIKRGDSALYIDFEDSAIGVVTRLVSLGCTREQLAAHFAYIGPDCALGPDEQEDLMATLHRVAPSVIVVDGVNAAMTLLGLDLEKNKEATQFHQRVLKPLTAAGNPTVITVDHVPKDPAARGTYAIGAQAKRAMIDGAMLGVSVVEPFGRGRKGGKLDLWVMKDRLGGVRGKAIRREGDKARIEYVATAYIDSEDDSVTFLLGLPDVAHNRNANEHAQQIRMLMHHAAAFLSGREKGMPRTTIGKALRELGLTFRNEDLAEALRQLGVQGYIERVETNMKFKGEIIYHYRPLKPYAGDLESEVDMILVSEPAPMDL